jgi:hypothetical protein
MRRRALRIGTLSRFDPQNVLHKQIVIVLKPGSIRAAASRDGPAVPGRIDRAPRKPTQLFGQGLVVGTRSGLPGELFGMISVIVHEAALSAVAMTGTPGVSM